MRPPRPTHANNWSRLRLTTTAVNMLISTPIPKLIAKPVTNAPPKRSPNQRSTPQVINVEILPSRMAGHARLNPTSIDDASVRPMRTSSFIRSKISTLASTAIPMDRIKPPMWERVKVMGMSLNTASTTTA